jgi:predicted phosphodiesterase
MGDTGEGNTDQRLVAVQVRDLCAAEGCDFVILLGDNIYDAGVDSVTDDQWRTKFEEPYRDLDLPFYPVLGNHDYGGRLIVETGGLGNEFFRGPIEVEYSMHSTRWRMPATFYTLQFENVGFVMLDTNSILWNNTENGDQWAWYLGAVADLEAAGAEWIIVSGHHPYRSNGRHGNAGSYESIEVGGVELPNPVPILNGGFVRTFFEDIVCGTADVVFAGHDHNRQWLDEPDALCGAELIVSGAGAKTTSFEPDTNASLYQDDTTPGFLYVVIDGDSFYGRFVDIDGMTSFESSFARRP